MKLKKLLVLLLLGVPFIIGYVLADEATRDFVKRKFSSRVK
jgi:hypothetical protein